MIDPVVAYYDRLDGSPFLGSPLVANGYGVAVTPAGVAYFVGQTKQAYGFQDGYVISLDTSGNLLGSSVTFGGTNGATGATAVALDSNGNVFITGETFATDANLTGGGFQPTLTGSFNGFLLEFNSDLTTPLYWTYFGGGFDTPLAIAVDGAAKAYICGVTYTPNFPTTVGPGFRASYNTAFLVKIDPAFPNAGDQRSLVYSTLIGGTGVDEAYGVAVDAGGNAYVAGDTNSTPSTFLPTTTTGFMLTKTNSFTNGFLVKLDPTGANASWMTFIPGALIYGVALFTDLDSHVNAIVAGAGGELLNVNPIHLGFQTTPAPGGDALLQRYDTAVNGNGSFVYSTYIGGNGVVDAQTVTSDSSGVAYVLGREMATDFPSTGILGRVAVQQAPNTFSHLFLAQVDTNASGPASEKSLLIFGGDGSFESDTAYGVALDSLQNVYLTGTAGSDDFAGIAQSGAGPYALKLNAGLGIGSGPALRIGKTHMDPLVQGQNGVVYTVVVNNGSGPTDGTNVTVTETLPGALSLVSMSGIGWNCSSNSCSRNDVLNGGSSYPSITVTVNVASNAASPQVNHVSVSGGGSGVATALDTATINLAVPATMSSPAPGSTLSGSSSTFQWNAGTGVSQYRLSVSKISAGGNDLFDSGAISQLSQTVNGLPTDGSTLYATLYSLIGSTWTSNAYTYKALLIVPVSAAITSPTPGSTLSGASTTLQWNAGTEVLQYWLYVSKISFGRNDLFDSGAISVLSQTVNNLPTDGSTLYVTLYSLIGSNWAYNTYTYKATLIVSNTPSAMTSPTPGSTLSGASATFQWNTGTGVSQYWLYVSKISAGRNDLFDSGALTALSQNVNNLPTDGSTLYVTLYSLIGSTWTSNAYTYKAVLTVSTTPAAMTSPTPGSTLSSASATFQWNAGSGVSQYWLYVSKVSAGRNDLFDSGALTLLSQTVNNLPTDGSTLYVTLYSLIGSTWTSNNYTYKAVLTVSATPAAMTSPTPGSTLSGASATFQWNAGSGVSQYWQYISKISAGRNDLFDSGALTVLSQTVNNLPTDGSTLYVTLYSLIGSTWTSNTYTYTATLTVSTTPAAMTSPTPGSTLSSASATFQWNAGSGVSQYWLYVSKISAGRNDLFDSGGISQLSQTVNNLPTDGSTLYVTLYSLIGSNWVFNSYTYKATLSLSTAPAAMTSPTPGSTLSSASATFQWNAGSGVSQYWLYVSKISAGRNDLFDSGALTALSQTVNNLPTDGSTLYVTLYSLIGSTWTYNTYTYKAALSVSIAPAAMTSPTPGSTLSGASATFQWNAGSGVSQYWLYISKISAGRNDLFDSGGINQLSQTVNNLPTDGSTLYVTLYSLVGSTWAYNIYTYQAFH